MFATCTVILESLGEVPIPGIKIITTTLVALINRMQVRLYDPIHINSNEYVIGYERCSKGLGKAYFPFLST